MITFVDSAAMERERESDRCLDPQLWHACAGGMVQMPPVHSKVYYFPQGHAEHVQGPVDLPTARVPALVLCRVAAVRFMADPDTDEVFAKIRLAPVRPNEPGYADDAIGAAAEAGAGAQEDKPASFAKTLAQSDANGGGGFSVPRYCAETIFPRLDYSADPPVQTLLAKDVHGVVWKFRHIYRGTPRRHLLTTGWSTFVNQKKLVAGDSIVFMRTENGDLCVGIRRAKKGGIGGPEFLHHHQPPPPPGGGYAGFSMFLTGEDDGSKMMATAATRGDKVRVRVRPEEVVEAANLAVSGQPFEVVYYPRASTPEFCVKAAAVLAAMRTQWCAGMRFKMAFETDSSRINWFMGTVSAVQVADPIRWPNSPWRLLQVAWDEPDLLQNVKRVSPWLVELVSNMPAIQHLTLFSPPHRKKLSVPLYPKLPLESQFPVPMFHGSLFGRRVGPMCYFPAGTPAGIQGASKSGNGEGAPAGPVGDAERSLKAEPAGEPQVGVCSASIRRLFQELVHVRTTMSSFSGKLPSYSWFDHVKHLTSDAEESLEHLHYKMMLAKLGDGTHLKKVMPNVSGTYSKTTAISFMHLLASQELVILAVTDKLEGLRHGSPGLSGAVLGNYSDNDMLSLSLRHGSPGLSGAVLGNYSDNDMLSLSSSVMRCILLCRGILGIVNIVNMEGKKESLELPVFAFDDMTYAGQNKGIGMNAHSVPAHVSDPIYLSSMFIRSLLCLDLSSCSGLTQLPPSIGDLSNLAALNLSRCYSLHTLPVSVGRLKNLKILVLSCCHELRNLPVSVCELSKLRLLDLAGCSSLENLPASLVNLGKLENLNLSHCKELKEVPQPFGNLQELRYLNISGSHRVDLDVECLCTLANLKSLTLSPLTNIQGFPDSFKDLANRLDSLRWWKNQMHPQCGPKATSLHSYRRYELSIIDTLLSDEADNSSNQIVTSACIVGESGMGKTELVHRIYNNRMILDTFDLRIWLNMCDKKRLLGKIVELTTCASCSDASISVLEEIVIEELTGKRLLLVLDDSEIKSQYFWGYLRKLLNVCAKGSAVVVTTESKEVAYQIGAMQTFYLSPLSKEECFMIFKEHVLEDLAMDNYCQLESFGWKFVEKCGGNPMCIKAISSLLCHSEVELSEIDMIVDGILPALRLCYDLLPPHLQQCFKFCSLFPKDYIFVKCHIIRLWMAEGFVLCEEGTRPEETAMHYFDELCCRSFFQQSPFHNDHKDNFVMHELFHDLAQSVSKNECFRCEEPFCSLAQNVPHLSLVLSDFKTAALSNEVRNLQSFLVVRRCFPVVRIFTLDDIFVKHRFLRALNLSYTDILELPISIGNMKHLQLLALNNTKIKRLPIEIGQVNCLQTLELKDCCHLFDLPESTSNLAKLRHLDVQKELGNVNVGMPHGIGHLTDLQTLTTFNIGNDLLHCSISELKNLNGLRGHVHVTGLENIKRANDAGEANMMGKDLLEALTLEWSYQEEGMDDDLGKEIANEILQNLQPSSNIMELVIRNYAGNLFPVWMQDNYLCKLISVTLDNCHGCSELPYLGDLPSLKSLFIQRINGVERFGIETSSLATEEKHPTGFPSLEVLNICEMYDLQFWVSTREEDFPRLFRLCVSRCPKLTNLPRLISLVHVSFHYGVELPTLSELPSLESLKIEGFQKMRSISFPYQLTTLKKLEIVDCKELLSIYAYSLSVSDLKVVRCLKLDLVGSSMEDHIGQKVVSGRNRLTRRHMVLKTLTYTDLLDDGSKWEKFGEKNIFGHIFARSYYTCIWRQSTGCSATKILQPNNNDPNTLFVMYISEHNHEFSNEAYLELSSQLGTGRKRKEYDASSDENTSKKQLHDSSQ